MQSVCTCGVCAFVSVHMRGVHVWCVHVHVCVHMKCVHLCGICVHAHLCVQVHACVGMYVHVCMLVCVCARTCGDGFHLQLTEKHITAFLGRKASKQIQHLWPRCWRGRPPR